MNRLAGWLKHCNLSGPIPGKRNAQYSLLCLSLQLESAGIVQSGNVHFPADTELPHSSILAAGNQADQSGHSRLCQRRDQPAAEGL